MDFRRNKRSSSVRLFFLFLLIATSCQPNYSRKFPSSYIEKIKKDKKSLSFVKKSNSILDSSPIAYESNDKYLEDFKLESCVNSSSSKFSFLGLISRSNMNSSINNSLKKIFHKEGNNIYMGRFQDIDGWKNDNFIHALESFLNSCEIIKKKPDNGFLKTESVNLGPNSYWKELCSYGSKVYAQKNNDTARAFFQNNFTPFLISEKSKESTLFTSYYIYDLSVSKKRSDKYRYPIYKTPKVCKKKDGSCLSRCDVDFYGKAGSNNVILWTDDYIDRYLLHIQGSGIGIADDGALIPLLFDSKNNKSYRSFYNYARKTQIGKALNYNELLNWMRYNPNDGMMMLCANPSYVFFRKQDRPFFFGAEGSRLTPSRSVAIDNKFLPYGVPLWIDTRISPSVSVKGLNRLKRLFIAQDTGAAIDNPYHIDLYVGFGTKANAFAHNQRYYGSYFILIPDKVLKYYS